MGAPALSGSAELTQSSLGSRTISIVELLSRIEDIPMSAWVGAYTDSGSGNITVITSTKQVQQTIIGDCSLRGGGVQQLRVPLEPHHTAILMDCELQTEGKWPAMRRPESEWIHIGEIDRVGRYGVQRVWSSAREWCPGAVHIVVRSLTTG